MQPSTTGRAREHERSRSSIRRSSKVLADAEAAGLPPVQESTPEQVRANLAASFAKHVRAGRRGALGRGRGRRRRAGADLPAGRDRREEHGARLLPRRRLRGRQRRGLRPARARVREARRLRRDLGRLPARARAPVPGGARRRVDGDEVGDVERGGARARRDEDRRRRRQRRRRARGDLRAPRRATTGSRSPASCCSTRSRRTTRTRRRTRSSRRATC